MVSLFFTHHEQALALLESILLGAALGVFYNLLRAIRWEARTGTCMTALLDAFFWLVLLTALFEFNITRAPGQARYYIIAGMGIGASLVFYCLTPLCLLIFGTILRSGIALVRFVIHTTRRLYAFSRRTIRRLMHRCRQYATRLKKFAKTSSIFQKKGIK